MDSSIFLQIVLLSLIGAYKEYSTTTGLLNQIDERMVGIEVHRL